MKYDETHRTPAHRLDEAAGVGVKLGALRKARKMSQAEAAARAGVSRSTAVLIEAGDPSRTLAQVLRYLEAISSDTTLLALLSGDVPALRLAQASAIPKRVRASAPATEQGGQYDF
ncbi:MAG: helix-turn-helix domain-containing protein [Burkholderiaceae bacterium]|nr:helix-turn-helix domain-containing protein [Burkholderiaceae bacterium]